MDWRGAQLMPIGDIRVCNRCYDDPQEQLRAIVLPQDPVPIISARPELYEYDSLDYIGTGQTTTDPTTGIPVLSYEVLGGSSATDVVTSQSVGAVPPGGVLGELSPNLIGLDAKAQMPFVIESHWANALSITSIVANGTPVLTVNCASPHNLSTGAQAAISGTTNDLAFGFFNVTVTTATVFTVQANANVPSGTVSGSDTLVITTNAGVPWGLGNINAGGTVPQTGV